MKYAWIDAHRNEFDLRQLCGVLDISVSCYRAWKRGCAPGRKRLTDMQLLALIKAIHAEVKRMYGRPRMTRDEAKADIFEYIEAFYNRKRLHSMLGYVAAQAYMQNWLSSQ